MRIRKAIGAFIVNKKGEFLIVKRKDQTGHMYWDIIRGGIEKGEKPLETLKRELKEELGIDRVGKIRRLNLSYIFEFPDEIKKKIRFDKQKVELFFVALDEQNIKIDKKEILEFQLLNKKEFLETATFDTTKKVFGKMIKKIRL
jgi:putative (di)nucleoside polyphosphate hydrolase